MTTSAKAPLASKLALALASLLFALSLALWFLRPAGDGRIDQSTLDDPRVRDRVVEILAGRVGGSYDTHNDPDVGRLLQKNLKDKNHGGFEIDSNRFGLRERDYALPKPPGTIRVALVGDSFVFGTYSKAEDRAGVHLERFLRERSGREDIEVLHIGILSWNTIAEASYVRRQLSLLQPDLVIQVTLSNDLDDVEGVRGFGAIARFTSRHRERAEGAMRAEHPSVRMGLTTPANRLLNDHDDESRTRWAEAEEAVWHLSSALAARGAKYLHVFRYTGLNGHARKKLGRRLDDAQVAFLSKEFNDDKANWIRPDDMHWSPKAMREVALLCYGLIQQRGLLPMLTLPAWDEADEAVVRIHDEGAREKSVLQVYPRMLDQELDLEHLAEEPEEGAHVYCGIDGEGLMGPFAALSLEHGKGRQLRVRAQCLDRPEIDGGVVRVSADGLEVGRFELLAGKLVDERWPLPEALTEAFLTVRLEASDYAYLGEDLQECVALKLLSVSLEP
jgi:hypothetical protein